MTNTLNILSLNIYHGTLQQELLAYVGQKAAALMYFSFKSPTTRNEIAWQRYPENKQLYADYAFVQQSSGVGYDFAVESIDVSDHLPLVLQLE